MIYLKELLAILLSTASLLFLWFFIHKKPGVRLLSYILLAIIFAKFVSVLGVYSFFPEINYSSDVHYHYIRQGKKVLQGFIPYIGFETSYSLGFPYLMAVALLIWESAGSIAILMTIIESVMLYFFIRHFPLSLEKKYAAAILYSISYVSFYFVTLTAYNGIIIALFVMLSIHQYKSATSLKQSIAFQVGFWFSKLLMILYLPVVILMNIGNKKKLITVLLSLGISVLLFGLLYLAGIDLLRPIVLEGKKVTSGNIPSLFLLWFPFENIVAATLLNVAVFALALLFLFYKYVPLFKKFPDSPQNCTIAISLIVVISMCFMLLSKKSYMFYYEMFYFPLIVSLLLAGNHLVRNCVILAVLNCLIPLEIHLFNNENLDFRLLILTDIVVISINLYFLVHAYMLPKRMELGLTSVKRT